jgi:hypothetical protein
MNDKFDYVYDMGSGHWFRREAKDERWGVLRITAAALSFLAMVVCLVGVVVVLFAM